MQCQNYGYNLNSFGAVMMVSWCIMICFDIAIAYEVNVIQASPSSSL